MSLPTQHHIKPKVQDNHDMSLESNKELSMKNEYNQIKVDCSNHAKQVYEASHGKQQVLHCKYCLQ
jgi:hypothetical protein